MLTRLRLVLTLLALALAALPEVGDRRAEHAREQRAEHASDGGSLRNAGH